MSSDAQIAANRKNAQLSTGPTTETGKAISSHNAIKTGLTGRTVLLPTDDREAFDHHVARFLAEWKPATDAENALVYSLANTEWRLLRIPTLESGIYAIGRRQLGHRPPPTRPSAAANSPKHFPTSPTRKSARS